jgi:hypothetical protein
MRSGKFLEAENELQKNNYNYINNTEYKNSLKIENKAIAV